MKYESNLSKGKENETQNVGGEEREKRGGGKISSV
jgi:hypothetical protein